MITILIKSENEQNEVELIQRCIIAALFEQGFVVEEAQIFKKVAVVKVCEDRIKPVLKSTGGIICQEPNLLKEVAEQIWPTKKD